MTATAILVCGSSRSGTTLVARILDRHPRVHALAELHVFENLWSPGDAHRALAPAAAEAFAVELYVRQRQLAVTFEARRAAVAGEARELIAGLPSGPTKAQVLQAFLDSEAARQASRSASITRRAPSSRCGRRCTRCPAPGRSSPSATRGRARLAEAQGRLALPRPAVPPHEARRLRASYQPLTTALLWRGATLASLAAAEDPRVLVVPFEQLLREPEPWVDRLLAFLGLEDCAAPPAGRPARLELPHRPRPAGGPRARPLGHRRLARGAQRHRGVDLPAGRGWHHAASGLRARERDALAARPRHPGRPAAPEDRAGCHAQPPTLREPARRGVAPGAAMNDAATLLARCDELGRDQRGARAPDPARRHAGAAPGLGPRAPAGCATPAWTSAATGRQPRRPLRGRGRRGRCCSARTSTRCATPAATTGRSGCSSALAVVERLHAAGRRLPFAVEVLGFADEEGVRYGTAYLGSAVLAGSFDPGWLERRDGDGIALAEALAAVGGDPAAIAGRGAATRPACSATSRSTSSRGRCSRRADLPVGVVTGDRRRRRRAGVAFTRRGRPRRDGADGRPPRRARGRRRVRARASRRRRARDGPGRHRRPARGRSPGARQRRSRARSRRRLDVRHADDAVRARRRRELRAARRGDRRRRGVALDWTELSDIPAVACDAR